MRNPIDALFVRATVTDVAPHGRFRHVRLRAPQFTGVAWTPGQQVRVDCRTSGLFPVLRTYSVWDHADDWLELYCLVHGARDDHGGNGVGDNGDGPGSVWAATVAAGDEVLLSKPKGDFVPRTADFHLFVGEETAAAAFGPMIRSLPGSATARAVVEAGDVGDRLPLDGDVVWVPREAGASPAPSASLVAAVRDLALPPAGDGPVAYVAGEARTVQAVRAALVDGHGWSRRAVHTKPFWTPGKRGME